MEDTATQTKIKLHLFGGVLHEENHPSGKQVLPLRYVNSFFLQPQNSSMTPFFDGVACNRSTCEDLYIKFYIFGRVRNRGQDPVTCTLVVFLGLVQVLLPFPFFQLLPLTFLCLLLVRGFHLGSSSNYILVSTIERTFWLPVYFSKNKFCFLEKKCYAEIIIIILIIAVVFLKRLG